MTSASPTPSRNSSTPGEPAISRTAAEVAQHLGLSSGLDKEPTSVNVQKTAQINPNMSAIQKNIMEIQHLIENRDSNPNFDRDIDALMHKNSKRLDELKEEAAELEGKTAMPKFGEVSNAGEALMTAIQMLLSGGKKKLTPEEQDRLFDLRGEIEGQAQVLKEIGYGINLRERERSMREEAQNDDSTPKPAGPGGK